MRKYIWVVAAAALTAALSVGVATATAAKGGNSANAHLCQKGGWMNLQGDDGTQFANQDECVSFGAHGGTIVPKPPCTAGSDNFSDDALLSQPTTWNGGTIDGPYVSNGGIYLTNPGLGFPTGTKILYPGSTPNPFRLTFTNAVSSVQLDALSDTPSVATVTLTAYDSSDAIVDTDTFTASGDPIPVGTLQVSSATNNIKYFTMEDTWFQGEAFTNIVWACA